MTKILHHVILDNPLEDVFAYASDWTKWGDWFEGVSNFEPITKTKKGNGTIYRYQARLIGSTSTLETEIHDFVENKGWNGIARKGFPHKTLWQFDKVNENTRFTYGLEYKLPIPLIGTLLDSLFLKPMWDKIIRKSLQNLREKLQQQKA
jgi:hypothetical protein